MGKSLSSLDYSSLLHELTLRKWMEAVLCEDWRRAEIMARHLADSEERFFGWLGLVDLALVHLYRGWSAAALEDLTRAAETHPDPSPLVAVTRNSMAHVLIEVGRTDQAGTQARLALAAADDGPARVEALYFLGSVELKRGEAQEAERIARSLESIAALTAYARSRCHQLRADMASDSGSPMEAVRELEMARTCEDSEKVSRSLVPVRFSLAQAYWRVERAREAIQELASLIRSREACIEWPLVHVRSFLFLGRWHEAVGDLSAAEASFRRFLEHWDDADLDPELVAEARRFLLKNRPRA